MVPLPNTFAPGFLEDLHRVNIFDFPHGSGNPTRFPYNIFLSRNQIEWIYKVSWLKLNKQPIPKEQGPPPAYPVPVICLLWNGRKNIVKPDSKFDPYNYPENIMDILCYDTNENLKEG